MPLAVRRSLKKLGGDIAVARRKRRVSIDMIVQRSGVSKSTYLRIEDGEPSVALGAYAMCLFALGFGSVFGDMLDQRKDDVGLLMDEERLPKRIRTPKQEPAS